MKAGHVHFCITRNSTYEYSFFYPELYSRYNIASNESHVRAVRNKQTVRFTRSGFSLVGGKQQPPSPRRLPRGSALERGAGERDRDTATERVWQQWLPPAVPESGRRAAVRVRHSRERSQQRAQRQRQRRWRPSRRYAARKRQPRGVRVERGELAAIAASDCWRGAALGRHPRRHGDGSHVGPGQNLPRRRPRRPHTPCRPCRPARFGLGGDAPALPVREAGAASSCGRCCPQSFPRAQLAWRPRKADATAAEAGSPRRAVNPVR